MACSCGEALQRGCPMCRSKRRWKAAELGTERASSKMEEYLPAAAAGPTVMLACGWRCGAGRRRVSCGGELRQALLWGHARWMIADCCAQSLDLLLPGAANPGVGECCWRHCNSCTCCNLAQESVGMTECTQMCVSSRFLTIFPNLCQLAKSSWMKPFPEPLASTAAVFCPNKSHKCSIAA